MPRRVHWNIVLLVVVCLAASTRASDVADTAANEGEMQAEIQLLIERLGDPSYAERMRARSELEQMGLMAFDALHAAQYHHDSEVAMAARYLVGSLQVRWSSESDPREVREILDGYGTQSEIERKSRMDRLAALPRRAGLAALCRLVRFETSLRLSREAALLVLGQEAPDSAAAGRRTAESIRRVLGPNRRDASQWLLAYADDVEAGRYDVARWRDLIAEERRRVEDQTSGQTDAEAVVGLYRASAARAQRQGAEEEALRLALESIELVAPQRQDLLEAVTWAVQQRMWPAVLELAERHPEPFHEDPMLLYGLAEAYAETGRAERAAEQSERALAALPVPRSDGEPPPEGERELSAEERTQRLDRHVETAYVLAQRGRFDWAEQEYRYVIERTPAASARGVEARFLLSRMLGELERFADAAEVLRPVADRVADDREFRQRLIQQRTSYHPEQLLAQARYFEGMHRRNQGEASEARALFREGFEGDPYDVDLLIAMHGTEGDDRWRNEVGEAIQNAAEYFDARIGDIESQRNRAPNAESAAYATQALAGLCNHYAWLVANTEGDLQLALNRARRAVQLRGDSAALLDTLARCQFANGLLDEAIATQREALAIEPHAPPLQRQLQQFLQAREARDGDGESGDASR